MSNDFDVLVFFLHTCFGMQVIATAELLANVAKVGGAKPSAMTFAGWETMTRGRTSWPVTQIVHKISYECILDANGLGDVCEYDSGVIHCLYTLRVISTPTSWTS
mgnify:CR=1 FL=1